MPSLAGTTRFGGWAVHPQRSGDGASAAKGGQPGSAGKFFTRLPGQGPAAPGMAGDLPSPPTRQPKSMPRITGAGSGNYRPIAPRQFGRGQSAGGPQPASAAAASARRTSRAALSSSRRATAGAGLAHAGLWPDAGRLFSASAAGFDRLCPPDFTRIHPRRRPSSAAFRLRMRPVVDRALR